MDSAKHAVVISSTGYKTAFVLVTAGADKKEIPYGYSLQSGERLVYDGISDALAMIKPRWDGSKWAETAAPEEIAAARPKPAPVPPSETELLAAEMSMAVGAVQSYVQSQIDAAVAELSLAIAEQGVTRNV